MTEAHSGPLAACAWPAPADAHSSSRASPRRSGVVSTLHAIVYAMVPLAAAAALKGDDLWAAPSLASSSIDPLLEDIDSATRS